MDDDLGLRRVVHLHDDDSRAVEFPRKQCRREYVFGIDRVLLPGERAICIAFTALLMIGQYMLIFGGTINVVPWVYGPEILPLEARTRGTAVSVSAHWLWSRFSQALSTWLWLTLSFRLLHSDDLACLDQRDSVADLLDLHVLTGKSQDSRLTVYAS